MQIANEKILIDVEGLGPMEKPERWPLPIVAVIILLKASMTITNIKADIGSPCLTPCVLLKIPNGEPLTSIEKRIDEMQRAIQEQHFSPKPHLLSKYNKNFQLM
jgi:hypothetical protein